jgi:hypothetical protein
MVGTTLLDDRALPWDLLKGRVDLVALGASMIVKYVTIAPAGCTRSQLKINCAKFLTMTASATI